MAEGMGRVIAGRYRLTRLLGRGGMGAVWQAHDILLGRDVAIKESWHPIADTDLFLRRALREAQAAARLRHPGIVTIHDVLTEDGRPWIVMELVDGRSLAEEIREHGLISERRTAEIGRHVLGALRAAHREGVAHRDVKPANILLGADRVVLTDFGIAAIEDATALTGTGQLIGSPAYLAPERINGHPATAAADLWALGVTLYAAVTGRSPFQRDDTQATLAAILTSRPAPPAHAGRLWPVLKGLLVKDPARRLTAEQALKLLENVVVLTGAPTPAANRRWAGWRPGGLRRQRQAPTGLPETVAVPPPTVAAPTAYQDPPAAPPPMPSHAAPPGTVPGRAGPTAVAPADAALGGAGAGAAETVPGGVGAADAVPGGVRAADTVPSGVGGVDTVPAGAADAAPGGTAPGRAGIAGPGGAEFAGPGGAGFVGPDVVPGPRVPVGGFSLPSGQAATAVPAAPPVTRAAPVKPVWVGVLVAVLGVLAAGTLWIAGPGSRADRDDRATGPGAVAGSPGSAGAARITMGFAQVGAESGWRLANTRSIREASTAAGVELTFADAGLRQENQIKAIRSFIARRVDVIAFSPVVLSGWGPVLREAKAANIPVILTDRAVDEADTTLYQTVLGSDFVLEGRRAGEWLVTQYRGGSRVVKVVELRGSDGSAPADDRRAGFAEAIKGAPNLRVIASQSGGFTRAGGKEAMASLLSAHPDVDVLYAHNDDMGLGAIEAIEEAGRKPGTDIKIITVDGVKDGMTALAAGKINFIVECSPLLGPQLMELARKVEAGEPVPPRVATEETTFTQTQAKAVLADRRY